MVRKLAPTQTPRVPPKLAMDMDTTKKSQLDVQSLGQFEFNMVKLLLTKIGWAITPIVDLA